MVDWYWLIAAFFVGVLTFPVGFYLLALAFPH